MAERKIVKVTDFHTIARNNEYFIWHFLQKNQTKGALALFSYFDDAPTDKHGVVIHMLKYIIDEIQIPYFESYTEESMDFLMGLGYSADFLYKIPKTPAKREFYFSPIFLGFNRFKMVGSSAEKCYCHETLVELIMKVNPQYILDSNFD